MVELANDGVVDIFRILILETTKVIPNINIPPCTILSNLNEQTSVQSQD